ncbi:MAG: hypothetical protein R3C68_08025 [Myxococcota bacterium]
MGLTLISISGDRFCLTANDTAGTVSKIDTRTGKETARYCCAPKDEVDFNGNPRGVVLLWALADQGIVHRELPWTSMVTFLWQSRFSNQASITKIANDILDCFDANNNGTIELHRM